jgi:hypothetical protein
MSAPPDINARRADWAARAVETFSTVSGPDFTDEAISDLIADLGHLCDREKLDFVALVRKGVAYWKIEQTDEDGVRTPPRVDILIEGAEDSS